ncbi:MAG: hypothetical protein II481_02795 [Clostridia bacterium]|nr:hypothetical protein [Clostridia bacterium]
MSLLLRLLGFAVTSSAAIGVALALTGLLRKKASARSVYIAWLIVLIAVLVPFRPFARAVPVSVTPQVTQTVTRPLVARMPETMERRTQLPVQERTQVQETVQQSEKSVAFSLGSILLIVYGAGILASLTLQMMQHIRFLHSIRRWQTAPQERTKELYETIATEMGLKRTPPLYICPAADTPMLAGLVRPAVLLPDETLNLPELRLVFRHELTHWLRGDLIYKFLMMLAIGLHWYNPLIYLMRRGLEYACEASCDERVMRGQDLDARAYYSETIVAVIRRQSGRRTALSTTFYGGKKGMKNRIMSVMSMQRRRLGVLLLIPVLIITVVFSVAFAGDTGLIKSSDTPEKRDGAESLGSLFDETGEYLSAEEAERKAVKLFCDVREYGDEMNRPYEVTDYIRRDVTYGNETYETAIVDLAVTYEYPDLEPSVAVWRAYLTPRGGVPLMLSAVANGYEAFGYYTHSLILSNASTASLESSLPRRAYVNNALAASANITNMTTDYEWPMGTCFNGTEVTVTDLEYCGNNIPMLTDAAMVYWAHVQVGNSDRGGAKGWIPLMALTFSDELIGSVATLPQGTVSTDALTGYVNLYAGCDLQSSVLTSVRGGENVTLIGRYNEFWHVRLANGQYGYLTLESVTLDAEIQALEASVLPKAYDKIQPGQTVSYEEYIEILSGFYDRYGDSNEWTLEQAAQVSQFRQGYPFDRDLAVSILPGEDDMPEKEAYTFAKAYVEDKYGMTEDTVRSFFESLYYLPEAPDTHLWRFRFNRKPGYKDCGVTFDQKGNIVRDYESDRVNPKPDPIDPETLENISYYTEHGRFRGIEDDESVLNLAWETFVSAFPQAGKREEYEIIGERFVEDELEEELTWTLITIHPVYHEDPGFVYLDYHVAVVGERLFADDSEEYMERYESEKQYQHLLEMESKLGPFYAWTVEEKAEYAVECGINDYALPSPDVISQKEALSIARRTMIERVPMDEAELEGYHAFFSYCLDYEGNYRWRIDFYDDATIKSDYLDGYIVWIVPETGVVSEFWTPGGNG